MPATKDPIMYEDDIEHEDRPPATFMSARECAIDEQAALYDDSYDDYLGD
jgi:hypothetical protein